MNRNIFICRTKHLTLLLTAVFASLIFRATAQTCDCPDISECSPCMGGLTSLTLQYTGSSDALIVATDLQGLLFSSNVEAGGVLSFTGRLVGDKFGPFILITVNGIPNITISSTCGSTVQIGGAYGSFFVISATSFQGGLLCCDAESVETVPPVITGCPTTVNVFAGASCTSPATWTPPTAFDNCGVSSFLSTRNPGSTFPLGTTVVTYTAIDIHGNQSTCSFNVIVSDNTKPVFSQCPSNITVQANANCQATATWTKPTATDNCSAATVTGSHTPGSTFPLGETIVTYTAKDASGNQSTCQFKVTVKDGTPPVINQCPADIAYHPTNTCQATATWTPPLAADNCSVTLSSSHAPDTTFPVGKTTVTYTATDGSGNTTTCSFTVTVFPPEPTISDCPENITIVGDDNGEAVVNWKPPTATALCGNLSTTSSHEAGSIFTIGTTTVTYTFSDESGSDFTCTFDVVVTEKPPALVIAQFITPDGDGANDTWFLKNIERYSSNHVVVIDRWGSKLFGVDGYDNTGVVWKGDNAQGKVVPAGTYFYIIEYWSGDVKFEKRGSIEVIR